VNGGFFILSPRALDYIDGGESAWEGAPLERLAHALELMCYRHEGFRQAMDTLRDRRQLESLWQARKAPWKLWT
jgi:glucose-1-phosphate cytidylyltransferase